MSNLKAKFLIAAAAITAGTLGLAPAAFAGEGGVAGAAAFTLNGGVVEGVAAAIAVGKQDAVAGATHDIAADANAAAALGSAGVITVINSFTGPFAGANDTDDANEQANLFDDGINIDAINGTLQSAP